MLRDRAMWIAVLAPVVLFILVAGAWGVDALIHDGQVQRNVAVAGVPVGGIDAAALDATIEGLAAERATRPITVAVGSETFTASAAELGVSVDLEATAREVMAAGRDDHVAADFASWAAGFVSTRQVDLVYRVDPEATAATVESWPGSVFQPPIEPAFAFRDIQLEIQEGSDGLFLDPAVVASALEDAVAGGELPDTVTVDWSVLPRRYREDDLAAALATAEELTDHPIPVVVNERPVAIPPETARRWIRSTVIDGELTATFDETTAHRDLEVRLARFTSDGEIPEFAIEDDQVVVTELGEPARACCQPGVADLLITAASTGERVELPTRNLDTDPADTLERYGIVELVSDFTTEHACCQSRVDNIQRMADLVRGTVVLPGETFSINEHVGERTREKGFVAAGAIEFGRLVQDVGGGVSQFATTMFNAAFYAGLEFVEYQSHSIYFSRYPFGREATLGFPVPDLSWTNNTPYAILIWTEYTDTSITVELWSTKYWDVEETGQYRYAAIQCTRVETYRRRTAPDGRVFDDEVLASYRPAEGLDCFGNPTPRR